MKYLLRKLLRDLWDMRIQFFSVFLMSFLGVLIYTGIEGVWLGMDKQLNAWIKTSNLADAWVSGNMVSDGDISKIKNLNGIKEVQPTIIINTKADISNNTRDLQLMSINPNRNSISKPYIIAGDSFSESQNAVWINEDFAKENHININDNIKVSVNKKQITLIVRGLILSPEYISYTGSTTALQPDYKQYGYGYVSEQTMKQILKVSGYNQLKLIYSSDTNFSDLEQKIENILGAKYYNISDRTNFRGISNYIDKIAQIRKLSILFSLVFFLLALLTMQTTMKRLIETERTQIGTLKALGYHNKQLLLHFGLYGFIISLLGVTVGLITAPHTITPILLNLQKKFYSMPVWKGQNSFVAYVVSGLVILCCTITSILASKKGVIEMPAEALRNEAPRGGKQILWEHFSGFWNTLSFEWKWSLRDMSRNKGRTFMGIISVTGSMMLLIASFGLWDSLVGTNQFLYGKQYDYYVKIILQPDATEDNCMSLFNLVNKNGQWLEEKNGEIRTAKNQKNIAVEILERGLFIHLKDESGAVIPLPTSGVLITHKLAEEMGIQKGSTIQFHIVGNTDYITADVSDIITIPYPQGVYLSKDCWEKYGNSFKPTALLSGTNMKIDDISNLPYVKETTTLQKQLDDVNNVLNSVQMIVFLLLAAAVLLNVVVLYDLGVLNFTERKREYATMKVMGFHQKEIRTIIFRESIFNTVIGWLLGVPIGIQFLKIYVGSVTTDNFEYRPMITLLSFIIASCITIGTSMFVCMLISRKVKKLDMIESLKSVE
ncbi:ABC transporter permease [Aceticella autotrophica]|uniref:ABC transporter permease n=1 Tax=Aceticella autotrophica TaxID=2755338 RepID=A0A975AU00_9THEO|nr:ABC transporter permease [Aceticella autotrophica]QSZ26564.1 ABC transporter permease [Aceticella autotrophica]